MIMAFYCNGKKDVCVCRNDCDNCQYFDNSGGKEITTKKIMTNVDRIRAMTDEELAKFLAEVEYRRSWLGGGAVWRTEQGALDWLQQPAEGDA